MHTAYTYTEMCTAANGTICNCMGNLHIPSFLSTDGAVTLYNLTAILFRYVRELVYSNIHDNICQIYSHTYFEINPRIANNIVNTDCCYKYISNLIVLH